jgi:hypothetical protein
MLHFEIRNKILKLIGIFISGPNVGQSNVIWESESATAEGCLGRRLFQHVRRKKEMNKHSLNIHAKTIKHIKFCIIAYCTIKFPL